MKYCKYCNKKLPEKPFWYWSKRDFCNHKCAALYNSEINYRNFACRRIMPNYDFGYFFKDKTKPYVTRRNIKNWENPEYRKIMTNVLIQANEKSKKSSSLHCKELNRRRKEEGYLREEYSKKAVEMIKDPANRFGTRKGYPVIYNEVSFRSSWEVSFAKYLDSHNIPWVYEPKRIPLNNGHSYLPDFYLPDLDLYIEIKPEKLVTEKIQSIINEFSERGMNLKLLTNTTWPESLVE